MCEIRMMSVSVGQSVNAHGISGGSALGVDMMRGGLDY